MLLPVLLQPCHGTVAASVTPVKRASSHKKEHESPQLPSSYPAFHGDLLWEAQYTDIPQSPFIFLSLITQETKLQEMFLLIHRTSV